MKHLAEPSSLSRFSMLSVKGVLLLSSKILSNGKFCLSGKFGGLQLAFKNEELLHHKGVKSLNTY
jgi:hypothetical protein